MVGLRIDSFYGHDDQIGLFSKLEVLPSANVGGRIYPACFQSSWEHPVTKKLLTLYPRMVIAPVYHKIRLTFLDIQRWLVRLHRVIQVAQPKSAQVEWDVSLAFSNDYKAAVRQNNQPVPYELLSVLTEPHPRFMWRAALNISDSLALEVLFDATGIANGLPVYRVIWHATGFAQKMSFVLNEKKLEALLESILDGDAFLALLKDSLREKLNVGQKNLF